MLQKELELIFHGRQNWRVLNASIQQEKGSKCNGGDEMNPPFNLPYFLGFLSTLLMMAPALLLVGFIAVSIIKKNTFKLIYANSFAAVLFVVGIFIFLLMFFFNSEIPYYFDWQYSFFSNYGILLGIIYALSSIFIVLFGIVLMLFPPKSSKRERPPKPTLKP